MSRQTAATTSGSASVSSPPTPTRWFVRLNRRETVQHILFAASFVVLVGTGFMVHIPDEAVRALGDVAGKVFLARSSMHRVCAVVMLLVSAYHIYYVTFTVAGRRWLRDMRPARRDLVDLKDNLLFYLGRRPAPPAFDRFSYKLKIEYAALWVGNTLMAGSGLILWTESSWSKFFIDLSKVVHGMEAILATLSIVVWHLYEVQLRPSSTPPVRRWLYGEMHEDEVREEMARHYQAVMADPELREIYLRGPARTKEPGEDGEEGGGSCAV